MKQRFPIKIAALRTGLSTHLIRIWERRYGAVTPERTATNRRLYSDEDIQRLLMLKRATSTGMNIGNIADLSMDELSQLAATSGEPSDESAASSRTGAKPANPDFVAAREYLERAFAAIEDFDSQALEEVMLVASADLGQVRFLEHVVAPLFEQIGERWQEGDIRISHEHMASSVVRSFLGGLLSASTKPGESAPSIVIATPAATVHEVGAMMAAITSAGQGWRVIYLGAQTPADEIAGAARKINAQAIGLSVVYPPDDKNVGNELVRLRTLVGPDTAIIIGGRASENYRSVLDRVNATHTGDLGELAAVLEQLRRKVRVE